MALTLQVLYPVGDDTTFDHDYYANTHMGLVGEYMGPHMVSATASKGLAGGPDTPAAHYAIATITFADKAAMDAAMGASGPVLQDIPNYYNGKPVMLIGEVIGG